MALTPTHYTPSGTPLWQWTEGSLRPVPPPTTCAGCGQPAEGLVSWMCAKRLLHDFAGCASCARAKRRELEALGINCRVGRLCLSAPDLKETA